MVTMTCPFWGTVAQFSQSQLSLMCEYVAFYTWCPYFQKYFTNGFICGDHGQNLGHVNFGGPWLNFQGHRGTFKCVNILHLYTLCAGYLKKGIYWLAFVLDLDA